MCTEYTTKDIERFYEKVSKTPTERGCLEWLAFRNAGGYGMFRVGGRTVFAHRVAWEIVNGPIPAGLVIRHFVCDNPRCCNVAHLLLGTHADNTQDMMSKGRQYNALNTTVPYVRPVGPTVAERFYAKVSKTPTETGCLEWTAFCTKGYGQFGVKHDTLVLAHRFAWELVNGPIPDGLFVCHACDNPSCCNVDHLFLGTPADNTHDMIAKGRDVRPSRPGELSGMSKLTDAQVKEIRSPKYEDWYETDIAAIFGVSNTAISGILKRRTWRHLDDGGDAPIGRRKLKGERHKMAKLTESQVLEIRSGRFDGWTQRQVGEHFGVCASVISCVLNCKIWTHLDSSGDSLGAGVGRRGRLTKGAKNGSAKLTETQVLEIRSSQFDGWTQRKIAEHFGVSRRLIGNILKRRAWAHI